MICLVWHVSTCVGHLQVAVKRNDASGCLLYLHEAAGDVACVLDYVACSEGVSLGLCF
jgi:hypothetical protein